LSRLAVASASPSTSPRKAVVAPREATKTGKSGKIISEPTSVKKLVNPSAITAGGNRRLGDALALEIRAGFTTASVAVQSSPRAPPGGAYESTSDAAVLDGHAPDVFGVTANRSVAREPPHGGDVEDALSRPGLRVAIDGIDFELGLPVATKIGE